MRAALPFFFLDGMRLALAQVPWRMPVTCRETSIPGCQPPILKLVSTFYAA